MTRHSLGKDHVGLKCINRATCKAKGHLLIIGDALKVIVVNGRNKLVGEDCDLTNTDNFGQYLTHKCTKRCQG